MNAPKYQVDEILDVTLPGVKVTSVAGAESGEIEILLECPSGGLYRTDIPLNVAGIRRVTPAGGPPQPGEVWADTDGVVRWACRGAAGDVLLRDADNAVAPWQKINVERGPLVRVYSPAGAAPAAPGEPVLTLGDRYRDRDGDVWTVAEEHGQIGLRFGDEWGAWARVNDRYGPLTRLAPAPADQAETAPEKPVAPRLMVGDVWRGDAGADWRVVEQGGALGLRFSGGGVTREWGEVDGGGVTWEWGEVDHDCGPLTLVQRAGCRRTETTVPVWQLKIGQVVSHPDWCDGAPVRFFGALGDVRDLEITCRPLGWNVEITVPAARDAEATLWDEIAGGAR